MPKTRHSSIADRLKSIDSKYFEQIFKIVGEKLEKHFRSKTKKVSELLRFDSTLVSVSAELVDFGFKIGMRSTKNKGKNQVVITSYSIHYTKLYDVISQSFHQCPPVPPG